MGLINTQVQIHVFMKRQAGDTTNVVLDARYYINRDQLSDRVVDMIKANGFQAGDSFQVIDKELDKYWQKNAWSAL